MAASDNGPATLRGVAECLADEAAAYVRHRRVEVFGIAGPLGGDRVVASKSTPTDPVTVVDTETEALLRRRLAEVRPGEAVLGEEGGGPGPSGRDAGVVWVLDPIDGTVNFVYGIPAYSVSVAAQVRGQSVAGAVADVTSGAVYSAALGAGAHVRQLGRAGASRPLRCSGVTDLSMALLGTGFGYSQARRAAQAQLFARLLPVVRDVRRIGSAALDLCMVAAGRLDAHYEHGLHVWDWAAGALIAAEAGAVVTLPPAGGAHGAGLCLAAAPGVADSLREALERLGGLTPLPA